MNLHRKLSRFVTLAAVVSILGTTPAQAFRLIQNTSTGRVAAGNLVTCNDPGGFLHWSIRYINWLHNTEGQGAGKEAAIQAAMQSWGNVWGTIYTPLYGGGGTGIPFATDGTNAIVWASGNGCTGGCLALTALVLEPGQVIVESDITFNADVAWNTNGADFDTEAVMAHELGHSMGIHHSEVGSATMTAFYFGPGGRSLDPDDEAALLCIENRYPVPGPVSHLSIQASNGQWWVAEGGGGREINADRSAIGPWEVFGLYPLGAGRYAFQCVNGQYVVAEGGGGQELRCDRNRIDLWETFSVIPLGGGQWAFACANGQLVSADGGGGAGVYCNRSALGPWELFRVFP